MLHHIFSHTLLGIVLIIAGVGWILLAGFAGAMHPVPQNPSWGEVIPGIMAIVAGGLIIWWW